MNDIDDWVTKLVAKMADEEKYGLTHEEKVILLNTAVTRDDLKEIFRQEANLFTGRITSRSMSARSFVAHEDKEAARKETKRIDDLREKEKEFTAQLEEVSKAHPTQEGLRIARVFIDALIKYRKDPKKKGGADHKREAPDPAEAIPAGYRRYFTLYLSEHKTEKFSAAIARAALD